MQAARIVLGLALNGLLFLLSYVVPKQRGLIVLSSGLGRKFHGNTKYLFLYLLRRQAEGELEPHVRLCWLTENADLMRDMEERGWPVASKWKLSGFWTILRAEYLVMEAGTAAGILGHDIGYERVFLGRFKVIQTWHGCSGDRGDDRANRVVRPLPGLGFLP